PWESLTDEEQDLFLYGTEGERVYVTYRNRMGRRRSYMLSFEGIVPSLERRYRDTDSSQQRERIEEYMSFRPCPVCKGARLKPEVLAVTVGGKSIHEFTRLSVTRALAFLDELDLTETELLIGARIVKEIRERLTFLDNVGVGYLQLDRAAATLSGGEAQRLRLATQIGSQLVGVLYILDEPSIGLHQRDNGRLIETLERLHNLKGIDVEFPVGRFVCVTGVSGSGKSTLVNEIVYKALANRLHRMRVKPGAHESVEGIECYDKVIEIDQKPIGRTPRSNPATYTDLFTHVRELYSMTPEAKVRGYKPGRFSFNVRGGRCETCKGDGQIKIEMHFLPDVYV